MAENPVDLLPERLQKNLDRNLCVCNDVLKIDIINAIANGADTIEKIRNQTYATTGSGCCQNEVERLIQYIHPDHTK